MGRVWGRGAILESVIICGCCSRVVIFHSDSQIRHMYNRIA